MARRAAGEVPGAQAPPGDGAGQGGAASAPGPAAAAAASAPDGAPAPAPDGAPAPAPDGSPAPAPEAAEGSVCAAGLSDAWGPALAAPAGAPGADPLSIAEPARYERGLELGRGGMGRVLVARDRRLGRQVALKEVRAGADPQAAAARLLGEAQLAAGLDHPGIVAIHDAGRDARGQPFYTMRLVRGETLSRAARALPSPEARQRLVQPLIAVCHAVAHAHERHIVHRDLKPDNLLVGPHGETQVADWGLACTLAQAAQGGVVGTPQFMAPEVAAGQPASPRSDVYSLGATLVAVLLAEERDLARRAAALPPELRAIAERCLAADPARRYEDAAALAEDLSAWLEGRRVAAYSYSTLQLAGRLLRALRVPLLITAVALVLIVAVAWQGYRRTVAQRDRAEAAERAARGAQAQAERAQRAAQRHLSAAYAQAAEAAAAAGARPEAETLAAAALALGDAPAARGLLARRPGGPEVALRSEVALPPCLRQRLSPEGTTLLCIQGDAALLLGEGGALRHRWPGRFRDGAISEAAGRALLVRQDYGSTVYDLTSGAAVGEPPVVGLSAVAQRGSPDVAVLTMSTLGLVDLRTLALRHFDVCPHEDGVVAAAPAAASGAFLCACRSGRLFRASPAGLERPPPAHPASAGALSASAVAQGSDGPILLGARDGRLFADGKELRDFSGSARRQQPTVQALVAGPGGALALVGEGQGPLLWPRLSPGAAPARLPAAPRAELAFSDSGVVVAGERLRRYAITPQPPARFEAGAGLSQVAASPDGRLLAAGGGDGAVTVWRAADGSVAARVPLTAGVVKSLAFSPDGARLAVGLADAPGSVLLDVATWRPTAAPAPPPVPIKELGYFASGALWRSTYYDGFDLLGGDGRLRKPRGVTPETWSQGTSAPNVAGTALAYAMADGRLFLIRQEAPERPEALPQLTWLSALALSSDLRTVAVAEESRIRLLDVPGRRFTRVYEGAGRRIQRLAFSPDDTLLFAAELEGAVRVLRVADGREVAVLRGHSQRVAHVAFSPALGLLTAGWDGAVQRWDLGRLSASAQSLQQAVTARWGMSAEEALRATTP